MDKKAYLEERNQFGFINELEKIADMLIGSEKGTIVSGGIYAQADTAEESKKRSQQLLELIKKHNSVQKARGEYQKLYPKSFVTTAFKREEAPNFGFFKKLIKGKKYTESALKSYEDRSKNPRIFVRTGPTAGYQQNAFYNEVARGYRDDELNQPHIPKKDRVVYL